MRLEHYPEEKLKREILAILGRHLDLARYRVFFFGSRVIPGKGTERSDIDIGIEGPPIPTSVWFDILKELEEVPTLYTIQLVDFNTVAARFKEVALQHIETISP
ncbi:MAG: nucleotidyltransferase domain-containing protein [Patescibacteria group bacterium]